MRSTLKSIGALGALILIGLISVVALGAVLGLAIEGFEFGWNIAR